jgi:hypothetical protein
VERCFLPILLDAEPERLLQNVLADYEWFRASRDAGRSFPIRGEYERDLDVACTHAHANEEDVDQALHQIARAKLTEAALQRLPRYRDYAKVEIIISLSESSASVCDRVYQTLLHASAAGELT